MTAWKQAQQCPQFAQGCFNKAASVAKAMGAGASLQVVFVLWQCWSVFMTSHVYGSHFLCCRRPTSIESFDILPKRELHPLLQHMQQNDPGLLRKYDRTEYNLETDCHAHVLTCQPSSAGGVVKAEPERAEVTKLQQQSTNAKDIVLKLGETPSTILIACLLHDQGGCSNSLRRNMQGDMSASAHRSSMSAPLAYLQTGK